MSELSELKKQYERLGAEIEKLEQSPKPWPQAGDKYWFVDLMGRIGRTRYCGDELDSHNVPTGNCHRTEAEALAYREWQTDPRVVARGMIERQPGFDPSDIFIIRQESHYPSAAQSSLVPYDGGLRFSEMWSAQAVVEKHPDLCKVALGVITDKEEAGRIVREAISRG